MTTARTFVDVHVLQSVPPSNLNRDDTGSPKTAVYGGVRRARVSSQAWKRAARLDFNSRLDASELGVRTKRVVELVAAEVAALDASLAETSTAVAEAVLTTGGIKLAAPRKGADATKESGYLLFLAARQVRKLAELGVAAAQAGDLKAIDRKAVTAILKADNSIDLALFGRMVADVSDLNVDAAAQVAHAISTHAVDTEFDYFTAVDDHKAADSEEDAGAGMIGTVEFSSSTLYRYATLNVAQLQQNLGTAAATRTAVGTFIESFVRSMPSGKQSTFANNTLPDAIIVTVRSDQPISFVGAFEDAVVSSAGAGRVAESIDRLVTQASDIEAAYGTPAVATFTVGVGAKAAPLDTLAPRAPLAELVAGVGEAVAARLPEDA